MKSETVICLNAGKWTSLTRGVHNVCKEMAKKYQVLFVSKPPERDEINLGNGLKFLPSIRKIDKRLFYLDWPWWALKIHRLKGMEALMAYLRYKIITYASRKIKTENIAFLYVTHPVGFPYLKFFQKEKKIYHVFDNYSQYVTYHKQLDEYENENLKKFDYVFYLSEELLKTKIRFNSQSYFLTHGVNFDLFSKACSKGTLVPQEVEKISKPIVGLIGAISGKIDVDLLLYIANRKPEWFFLFVGPVLLAQKDSKTFNKLCNKENVLSSGYQPLEILPSYLKPMDVTIMPYRRTGHVNWINPLKTLEYFSAGKPVVSISLDAIKEYRDLIYFADEPEEWINQIKCALNEQNRDKKLKRMTIASNNTWAHRIENFYNIIGEEKWSNFD